MNNPILNIDTTTNTYTLDGKDISPHLTAVKVNMEGYTQHVELIYEETDVRLKGVLLEYKQDLKPVVCECGFEISPYNFNINCKCPNCGKNIMIMGGEMSCSENIPLFNKKLKGKRNDNSNENAESGS